MRKLLLLFISIAVLSFNSCKEENSTEPTDDRNPGGGGSTIVTENIGASGGEISNDNFSLVVPSGAFSESYDLKISKTTDDSGYEIISDIIKLEGLPSDLKQPIKLRVKATSTDQQDVKIMFKYENLIRSEWQTGLGTMLLDAQLVDGFYEAELELDVSSSPMLLKTNDDPVESDYYIVTASIAAVIDIKVIASTNGRFKIHYPFKLPLEQVEPLIGYFNTAFDKIEQLGFNFSKRKSWPLKIFVEELDNSTYGLACFSWWGTNYSTIKINSKHLNNDDELRVAIGHELLHIAQDFYDPFSWKHIWLDEATAVWIEEEFTDDDEFVSSAMEGYYNASFVGISNINQKPTSQQPGYGYGLAPMIKYIVQMEGESVISEMYEEIEKGTKPCNVIEKVTSESIMYWIESFYTDYILGKIYPGIGLGYFTNDERTEEYKITHTYVLDRMNEKYDDVSGRLYNFKYNYTLNDEKNFEMEFRTEWAHVSLFKYKGSNYLEKLGDTGGSMTIKDLNSYCEDKYGILALVTNGIRNDNFNGSKNIAFVIEINEMENELNFAEFTSIEFKLDVRRGSDDYTFFTGDANIDFYSESTGKMTASNHYSDYDGDVQRWTDIEMFINPEIPMIDSIYVDERGEIYGEKYIHRFGARNIPHFITNPSGQAEFDVRGESSCDKLTYYEFLYFDNDGNQTHAYGLSSIWCEGDSDIEIEFNK